MMLAILADIMIMKALDKDGNKVFKLEDKITDAQIRP